MRSAVGAGGGLGPRLLGQEATGLGAVTGCGFLTSVAPASLWGAGAASRPYHFGAAQQEQEKPMAFSLGCRHAEVCSGAAADVWGGTLAGPCWCQPCPTRRAQAATSSCRLTPGEGDGSLPLGLL